MNEQHLTTGRRRRIRGLAVVLFVAASAFACTTAVSSPSERRPSLATSPSVSLSPTATSAALAASSTAPSATSHPNGAWTGLSWSAPSAFPDASSIDDIVAWNGKLIAVGRIQNGGTSDAAIWDSDNGGTAWTRLGTDATTFADSQISGLETTPSGLVAWGWVGQPVCAGQGEGMICGPTPVMLWTSPDGVSWKRIADVSMFKGATIGGVTLGAQGLIAVGDTGWKEPAIWVSATGAAWQRLTLPAGTFKDANFSDVRATSSGCVLAGGIGNSAPTSGGVSGADTGTAAVWWSPDGRTWSAGTVTRAEGVGTSLGRIFLGAGGMVGVGSASGGKSATAWTSTEGRTWLPIANAELYAGVPTPAPGAPSIPSFSISDDGTNLLAVGVGDHLAISMWVSTDGLTWQQLLFSGLTDSIPHWPGDQGPTISTAYLVPDGLIVIGQQGASSQIQLWRVTALR
jgi:hypothetical protein